MQDDKDLIGLALNVSHPRCHQAANAFWTYWKENGETHKHGYYESTWGAINQAIKLVGVVPWTYGDTVKAHPSPAVDLSGLTRYEPAADRETGEEYMFPISCGEYVKLTDVQAIIAAPARDVGGLTLAALDAAFESQIKRVSTLEYNSNEICRHFYGKLREVLATKEAEPVQAEVRNAALEEAAQAIDALGDAKFDGDKLEAGIECLAAIRALKTQPATSPAPSVKQEAVLVPKWAGEFSSHGDWVNRAQRVLSVPNHKSPAVCVDAKGRRCFIGADMARARDENAFPVRYFWECELAAPSASQGEVKVPEGFRLVPIVPTVDMFRAFANGATPFDTFEDRYAAMLAAAPSVTDGPKHD